MSTTILVLAGGLGSRMGNKLPKPLLEVAGQPMLTHLLNRFAQVISYQEVFLTVPPNAFYAQAFTDWVKDYEAHNKVHVHLLPDPQRGVGYSFFTGLTTLLNSTTSEISHIILTVADVIAYDYAPLAASSVDIVLGVVSQRQDGKSRTSVRVDANGAVGFLPTSQESTHELVGAYRLSRQGAKHFLHVFAERLPSQVQGNVSAAAPEIGMTWVWPKLRDEYSRSVAAADLGAIVEANTPEMLEHMDTQLSLWSQNKHIISPT